MKQKLTTENIEFIKNNLDNYTTWNKGLTKETDIIEKIKMFIENE